MRTLYFHSLGVFVSSVNVLNNIKCSGNVPEMLSATVASRWMKFQLNVMCPGYCVCLETDDHGRWPHQSRL